MKLATPPTVPVPRAPVTGPVPPVIVYVPETSYAYLVIVECQGTLSVVLTERFKEARTYLDYSIQIFRRARSFDMDDVRMTSGFGGLVSAFWQPTTRPLVVGEAAGFQDFLWGFGIRHALHSGHLAARALHEGLDYEALVSRHIRPLVRASMVNRLLYDWAGDRTYRRLIRRFAASPDLCRHVRSWYRGRSIGRLLWPVARRRYERPSGSMANLFSC